MNMTGISPAERANAAVKRAELRRTEAVADVRELRDSIIQQSRRIAELKKRLAQFSSKIEQNCVSDLDTLKKANQNKELERAPLAQMDRAQDS